MAAIRKKASKKTVKNINKTTRTTVKKITKKKVVKNKKATITTNSLTNYYVTINDPVDLRINLLESSKDIIYSLQDYRDIVNLRKQKLKHMAHLKNLMIEITKLTNKLQKALPKHSISKVSSRKSSVKEFKEEIKKIEETKIEKPVPVKKDNKIDKLTNALDSIETRLKELKH
jgi:uncharacterized protein YjfI (DUF2170 family)